MSLDDGHCVGGEYSDLGLVRLFWALLSYVLYSVFLLCTSNLAFREGDGLTTLRAGRHDDGSRARGFDVSRLDTVMLDMCVPRRGRSECSAT